MSLSELVRDGYMTNNDYNCAETMLQAANEAYRLGLDERAMHAASPFGGGMGCERTCGALTGALMALGCMRARDRSHRDPQLDALRDELVRRFADHFRSIDCAAIKQTHRSETEKCEPVVRASAELLEQVLERDA